MGEEYGGYTNWETWNVALWLGNDEGLYLSTLERGELRGATEAEQAEAAKELVFDLMPEGTPDFDDTYEYRKVDWYEIVDVINEMCSED